MPRVKFDRILVAIADPSVGMNKAVRRASVLARSTGAELPRLARSLRAGLIVMGAVSCSGLKRIFIGNTAAHALDSLQCGVLIVKTRN